MCWGNKNTSSVAPSYLSGDLSTTCRPVTKWGPQLISQAPHTPLPSNCLKYVGISYISTIREYPKGNINK